MPALTLTSAHPGGKYICGFDRLVQLPKLSIFSFGVEHQSSFEEAFLRGSEVAKIWAADFSVSSIGPEVADDPALRDRVRFKVRSDTIFLLDADSV